jgi:hypothetical protein
VRTPRDIGLTGRSDITPTPRPLIRKVRNRSPNSECVQRMLNSKRKGQWVQQAISSESVSTGSIEFQSLHSIETLVRNSPKQERWQVLRERGRYRAFRQRLRRAMRNIDLYPQHWPLEIASESARPANFGCLITVLSGTSTHSLLRCTR